VRSVRHEAALGLVGADAEDLPADARQQLGRAMRELQQALLAKADFPETQLVLGGIALTLRNFEAAEGAFERAAAMDPQRVEAWDILARIRGARGDRDGAAETLRRALRHNPGQPAFLQALAELGE
jgi:cytochrome c-type biogenesis protein CcmH/NrfG